MLSIHHNTSELCELALNVGVGIPYWLPKLALPIPRSRYWIFESFLLEESGTVKVSRYIELLLGRSLEGAGRMELYIKFRMNVQPHELDSNQ